MHISAISTMNFCASKATMVRSTVKKADKEADKLIKETLESKSSFVNYNESSYSVPTGEFPKDHMVAKRYAFSPEDNLISNEYIKITKKAPKEEEVVDFVSDGSIL